jgi:hypothetical protein
MEIKLSDVGNVEIGSGAFWMAGMGSRRVLPAPPYPVDISNPIASYIIYEEILNVHLIFIKHRNKT